MINSKEELRFYLDEDKKANVRGKFSGGVRSYFVFLVKCVIGSDDCRAYLLLKSLRKYEYAINCMSDNFWGKIYRSFLHYRYHRHCIKCNVFIVPNTIGYGMKIQHIKGGGCVIVAKEIGNYFSVRQYTTVGKANGDDCPIIGNNVTLGANVTIIGNITIGDNCIIGAGTVVVKDVPSNSIVVGNPGRVIGNRIPGKRY